MTDKKSYCTVENDGVAVCVCKYRPCEKLKLKEQECDGLTSQLDFAVQQKECLEQECEEKDEGIRYFKKCLDNSFKMQTDSELWWEKERNKLTQKLKEKEQECEKLKEKLNYAAEENKFQFVLREENNRYEQALDEIERVWETDQDGDYNFMKFKILDIINKAKEQ